MLENPGSPMSGRVSTDVASARAIRRNLAPRWTGWDEVRSVCQHRSADTPFGTWDGTEPARTGADQPVSCGPVLDGEAVALDVSAKAEA